MYIKGHFHFYALNNEWTIRVFNLTLRYTLFQRNPRLRLYGLPWVFPGWLRQGGASWTPYANRTKLVNYIISWLDGARAVHNLTIDYIGVSKTVIINSFIHSSSSRRSDTTILHGSRSCQPYRIPVHSLMFVIHSVLGLPLIIFPSS